MGINTALDDFRARFEDQGGYLTPRGMPVIPVATYRTEGGTPYLTEPGVAMVGRPSVDLEGLKQYFFGFDPDLKFEDYLLDLIHLPDAEALTKFAAQGCYLSFGPKRTRNEDAEGYFEHIKQGGHGSVLEHANFSFWIWGVSRSLTHELVRHRVGVAISQQSQRFVGGRTLRFVERPEFAADPALHERFLRRCDRNRQEYEEVCAELEKRQKAGAEDLQPDENGATQLRKRVRQAGRAVLPNETESALTWTVNVRTFRSVCDQRLSVSAEVEYRVLQYRLMLMMGMSVPLLLGDYHFQRLIDETYAATTEYRRV